MNDTFRGPQVAVVIGGSSDIAAAIVDRLARSGLSRVVLLARDQGRLGAVAARLRQAHPRLRVDTGPFDAAVTANHAEVLQHATEGIGDIDLVIVAAGALGTPDAGTGPLGSSSEAVDVMLSTFVGPVSMMHAAVERLHAQGHGTLMVISSAAALRPRRTNPTYGSAKAGLDAFSAALRDRLHGSGVSVMVVRPGYVSTHMTADLTGPKPPMTTTADRVAADVVEGLRHGRTVVWSPRLAAGPAVVARLLPSFVLRRMPW